MAQLTVGVSPHKHMWIDLEALTGVEESYVTAVGRALMVAQHFEANCEDVVMWWVTSGALEDGKAKSLSDVRSISETLTDLMLGGLIKRLGVDRDITKAEIAVLVLAKDARNYVAHEAVAETSFISRFSRRKPEVLLRFEKEVRALIGGTT